jgi:DNA mismatch repair protein MutL
MSDLIQLLPDHIANQIAAGEVIQRPASVVKELIENAIDAGADTIQLIVKDAGKTLIQISDNGKGMTKNDAIRCFERHATSKLKTADDLFALTTKGFRGEALASVAAIAHITLKTKQADQELGNIIEIEGSKITKNEAIVCANGTTFSVKNLFYNVPARRNFLKSDTVEFNHISDEFVRIALAHPAINFVFTHNEQEIYHLRASNNRKRIVDIVGQKINDKLVPIEEETEIVTVHGFVGKPEYAKKTRGEQFLFVNDRYFKDSFFHHAISKAFDGLLQLKHFPSYFLYLTIDPKKIDVNVHPTKTEIKFEEDRLIYAILLSSIRQALGKYNIAPTIDFERENSFDLPHEMRHQPIIEPVIKVNTNYNPFNSVKPSSGSSSTNFSKAIRSEGFGAKEVTPEDWQNFYQIEEEQPKPIVQEIEFDASIQTEKAFINQGKYLFTPCKSGLMVIDIQRALERIVYDELMSKFVSSPIVSQQLLFSIEREFSKNESAIWIENKTMLERLGFQSIIENQTLQLNAVPAILQEESIQSCLDLILENISFKEIEKGDIAHFLIVSIAQAAGRKKSKVNSALENEQLIEQLFQCAEHAHTPLGKKIVQTLTFEEIALKF